MGVRSFCLYLVGLFLLPAAGALAQNPNDPQFDLQWGLHNTGQGIAGRTGTPGFDVAAPSAWQIHPGTESVVVAIVGRGIDPHPEFADRLLEGHATSGDPFNTLDTCPHDTHLAGIIAASTNNHAGIAGLIGQARLLPVRVFDGCVGTPADTAEGIIWAVDHGADVILAAVQFFNGTVALADAVTYAVEHDVVIVAPAGSTGTNEIAFPAAYPGSLAVAATTNEGDLSSVSNFGPAVDLVAPGRDIWSTWIDGGYAFLGPERDTAAAAAFVAGVAALVRSYAPQLSAADVARLLIDSAEPLGSGGTASLGVGQVNARRALENAQPPALRFEHVEPVPTRLIPGRSNSFAIRIVNVAEEVVPGSARLVYREGTSSPASVPMRSLGGDLYLTTIPAAACDSALSFFLTATGSGGDVVQDPIGAPDAHYAAEAVLRQTLFVDDFESNRKWIVEVAGGTVTQGAWSRVIPVGTSAQPGFDHSPDRGAFCYVTGQHDPQAGAGADDVDFGPVRLISPPIDLPVSDDVEVSYARWFYWNGQHTEDFLTVECSRDDGGTWSLVETVSGATGWRVHRFRLSDYPELTGGVLRVRFTTADVPNDSLTEAAVDDFRVEALHCSQRPGDANLDGLVDAADFRRAIECLTGPANRIDRGACGGADFDDNLRVDLLDLAILQRSFPAR